MDIKSLLNEIMALNDLPNCTPFINWRFNFEMSPYLEPKLSPNYRLMIDKRFIPSTDIHVSNELRTAWMNFVIGVACYAYRTVGKEFPREFKILLANSAVVVVLSGYLAERDISQQVLACDLNSSCNKSDKGIPRQESIHELDDICKYVPDGEWIYGLWTMENLASILAHCSSRFF
ncbi:hypothetical protein MN116_005456 [Schistosoma mekongi]|uniref:Uncharacterized protein n=1 Tax=Schistosoma mekongi TaxID=38744 RepID=A0AAE1ZDG2_SCHME|nr:hypothetical protein MN116_005456 [Schistosoma mekongi]